MITTKTLLRVSILLTAIAIVDVHAAEEAGGQSVRDSKSTSGYNCLFIGHSFFIPVAKQLPPYAQQHGLKAHKQQHVFAGGAHGAPGALWNGPKRKDIEKILATGTIDLLGMTYYRGETSNLQAYQRWVDTAMKHNPRTIFFIGLTWPKGGGDRELAEFTVHNQASENIIAPIVTQLQALYPDNRFIFLNYGPAAIELKRMFEAGELPEITALKNKKHGLFKDDIGHANRLLEQLSALMWMTAIYSTDLNLTTVQSKGGTNLGAVATRLTTKQAEEVQATP